MSRTLRALTLSTLVVASLALSGCYRTSITTAVGPTSGWAENKYVHTFVYGLFSLNHIDGLRECPQAGVARVQTRHSALTVLAEVFTFGLYAPVKVEITCLAPMPAAPVAPPAPPSP